MSPEELRAALLKQIEKGLSMRIVVRGEERRLLQALEKYVADMATADLEKLNSYLYPRGETT